MARKIAREILLKNSIIYYMASEVVVREIVETYDDLSPELKERIISIATKRTSESSLDSFDAIYGYIGYLIDRFREPYARVVSLDSPITPGSDLTFHGIIGVEDNYFEEAEGLSAEERLSANVAVSILQAHTDKQYAYLLHQLSGDDTLALDVSPEDIVSNAPQIRARLEELLHKYGRNGRLIIPARPIVTVNFNPLQIRFGTRHYHGDPLAHFMEHKETYEGMGRSQLKLFDAGLHWALLTHKQLTKAIPQDRRFNVSPKKFSSVQITDLVNAYPTFGGNGAEAARHFGYSRSTALRYWKGAGLKIYNGGTRVLTQSQIDEIIESYWRHGGNITAAAEDSPYSYETVIKYVKEAELPVSRPGGRRNNRNSK